MVTRDEIVASCDAYLTGLSTGDVDGIMALYDPNATIIDPIGSPPKVGHDAIREFYASTTGVALKGTRVGPVTVVGHEAAFLFRIDVDLGESTISMASIDLMTFNDDGKVTAMRAYPDSEAHPDA